MGVSELWHRIMEKVGKITEPFALSEISDVHITQKAANYPALPSRETAPVLLKQTLANDAAKLLNGKWTLFGWKEVRVSSPPDWHRDYMRGVSVPKIGGINHRTLPDGADVRAIWEINRWAEPVRLAMHGWLNDDPPAIQRAQQWLADWVKVNPVGEGINWTSALEGGLRLINFCWFDALVSQMGEKQSDLVDSIVPAHVWWVNRHLSFGSSANNHRLGELAGLLLAVKRWPEMEQFTDTAESLWKQIADCIMTQFAEDGGNREQALHYHLFAYEIALHACNAMKVTEGPVIDRLQRAADFFVRMSHPQESWDYGDNDDAQLVPLTMHREKAAAEWGAWMHGCGTGLQPVCPTGILPDQEGVGLNYWLRGEHGQYAHAIHKSQTCATDWWIAPQSGMAVIERDGWKLRVDASPLGFGKLAAHGHCDAMHVSIWDGENALVIDPGTGGYFGAEELRTELASWNAHNGPQPVEGFKTPRRAGTFLWACPHSTPEIDCVGDEIHVRFSSEEHCFSRTVRFIDGVNHVAVWDLESNKKKFKVRWQIAPDLIVRSIDSRIASFEISRGRNIWSMSVMSEEKLVNVTTGRTSRFFGEDEPGSVIEVVAQGWLRTEWHRL